MIYVNDRFKPKRKSKKQKGEVFQKYKPSKVFVEYEPRSQFSTFALRVSTTNSIPSHGMSIGNTDLVERPKYTGENLLGIAVMHKSNLVPVFKAQDAVDIARMRRG